MRKKELFFYIPMLAMLILVAGVYFMFSSRNADTQAPNITIDTELLEVSVRDPENALLEGVSAADDQDGDVTNLMVIEKVSDLMEDHTAIVTYAAFDHSGNVSKASRTIHYADYTSPVFGLTSPLVFTVSNNVNVQSRITVTDILDGDISSSVKGALIGNSTGLNTAGTHYVDFRVTNSLGDTARITLPVDVLPANSYSGSIQLTRNIVYLKRGERFEAEDYFKSMTPGITTPTPGVTTPTPGVTTPTSGVTALTQEDGVELTVSSDVDTAVPGVYSAAYTAKFDAFDAYTRLIVVVE